MSEQANKNGTVKKEIDLMKHSVIVKKYKVSWLVTNTLPAAFYAAKHN